MTCGGKLVIWKDGRPDKYGYQVVCKCKEQCANPSDIVDTVSEAERQFEDNKADELTLNKFRKTVKLLFNR